MAPAPSLTPEHVTILPERILRYIFSFIWVCFFFNQYVAD